MTGDVTLRAFLLVAAGAVAGATLRWMTGVYAPRGFPWATVIVNGVGSFLVGLLLFGGVAKGWLGEDARLLLGVGFLGALTTMSAFAAETVAALDEGAWGRAALVLLANPVLSVGAAYLGRLAAYALPSAS